MKYRIVLSIEAESNAQNLGQAIKQGQQLLNSVGNEVVDGVTVVAVETDTYEYMPARRLRRRHSEDAGHGTPSSRPC